MPKDMGKGRTEICLSEGTQAAGEKLQQWLWRCSRMPQDWGQHVGLPPWTQDSWSCLVRCFFVAVPPAWGSLCLPQYCMSSERVSLRVNRLHLSVCVTSAHNVDAVNLSKMLSGSMVCARQFVWFIILHTLISCQAFREQADSSLLRSLIHLQGVPQGSFQTAHSHWAPIPRSKHGLPSSLMSPSSHTTAQHSPTVTQ